MSYFRNDNVSGTLRSLLYKSAAQFLAFVMAFQGLPLWHLAESIERSHLQVPYTAKQVLKGFGSMEAQADPSPQFTGDIDQDCNVDRDDLVILLADRNKSVEASSCGEACDLDGDGVITVLDSRRLVLECTQPRCAVLPNSCANNTPPVSNAGPDQTVTVGDTVTLDGSGSADSDGDFLTFTWSFLGIPQGSTALLTNPSAVMPSFVLDVPGTYFVQLIVNDGTDDSTADIVEIDTANSPPIANAGPDQTVPRGSVVFLDGSLSSDFDGDPLFYNWTLTDIPSGSNAELSNNEIVNPTVTVDRRGRYTVTLEVDDGELLSEIDTVVLTTENSAPVADAGIDQTVDVGDVVQLDGSGSSDADNDSLTYLWSFTSTPANSLSVISDPAASSPSFVADVEGLYVLQLIVSDGELDSTPDTARISVEVLPNNPPVAAISTENTSVELGSEVTLDGSESSDPDGDLLTYQWMLTPPSGSNATLSTASAEFTTFVPDVSGNYTVYLGVNDGFLSSSLDELTIAAIDTNNPPDFIGAGNRSILQGQQFSTRLFAIDPDPGDTLTFSLSQSPIGMTIDSITGDLQWTPANVQRGAHDVIARVSDSGGLSDTEGFTVEVTQPLAAPPANEPPELESIPNRSLTLGASLTLQSNATDPDSGDTLTYSLPASPAGMTINAGNGQILWTPDSDQVSSHDVAVQVEDSGGLVDLESFTVTVNAVNSPPETRDDIYTTLLEESLIVSSPGVLENDSDPDGDNLSVSVVNPPNLGTLDSFPGDGSFTYIPPPTPEIEIGLQIQCSDEQSGARAKGVAVGDIDADGEVEIVTVRVPSLSENEIIVLNGSTCERETIATIGNGEDFGEPDWDAPLTMVNLDSDPELEIVLPYGGGNPNLPTEGNPDYLMALNQDGSSVWSRATRLSEPISFDANNNEDTNVGPTPVDLDGDGNVELLQAWTVSVSSTVVQGAVVAYDGQTGDIIWEYIGPRQRTAGSGVFNRNPTVVDIDLDGEVEIIWYHNVINSNGELKFLLPVNDFSTGVANFLISAVANFDDDPYAEIIALDAYNHYLFEHTGAVKWSIPREMGSISGGIRARSLITVGQFDDDPQPEYVVMRRGEGTVAWGFFAYDTDGSEIWSQFDLTTPLTVENSLWNRGVPVAFDFDRDGIDELVMQHPGGEGGGEPAAGVHIFSGEDGSIIASDTTVESSSAPAAPLTIADVDGDGAAEIVVNDNGVAEFRVYEGLPDNPFPSARPIRNHANYQPSHVNDDGSIPTYIQPHWLTPGLNKFFATPVVPDPGQTLTDSFTDVANDGAADSNEATVTIALEDFNAPEILSTPGTGISPGFKYTYGALAYDADFGDVLSWTLADGPAGMSVDTFGVVTWSPQDSDLGVARVQLVVTDSQGYSDTQSYEITVESPIIVPDVVGQTEATAETTLLNSSLTIGRVSLATHPFTGAGQVMDQSPPAGAVNQFGGSVDLVVSLGPGPADIDDDGDGFSENQGDCNDSDNTFYPGADDPNGDGNDQDCDGIDGNLSLVAIIVDSPTNNILTGRQVTLEATGIFDDGTSQKLTELVSWSTGSNVFSSGTPGSFTITATRGAISGDTTIIVAGVVSDSLPPVATITSPAPDSTITEPVDILGTASDDNFLKYELAYAVAGSNDFTVFNSSTSAVADGVLGQFDPTLLLNDLYTLRLTVYDRGGNSLIDEETVQVDGNLKVGNFTLSFTDLSIPMSGLPITVTRTYDSIDKSQGDFGIGWQLGIQSLRLRTNRVPGTGWQVSQPGLSFVLQATDTHKISLTLPGGRVEEFDLVIRPTVSALIPFPPFTQTARFQPRPGTLGELESLDNNNVNILDPQPGMVELREDTGNQVYDPQRFRYTAVDGTRIVIHKTDGVESLTDPNGNTLSFGPDGITHSAGKSVSFSRDDLGRITAITDPMGNVQTYTYDANGDLRSHTDAEGNSTRFDYNRHHGIIKITDPLNRPIARNEYDAKGRLVATIDVDGNRSELEHDLASRVEIQRDPDGAEREVEYDDRGNILREVDETGGVVLRSYDDENNIISQTNAYGGTTTYTYDGGYRTSKTDGLGATTQYTRDPSGRLTSITDAAGNVTSYQFDSRGNHVRTIDPSGHVTERVFDNQGQLLAETDARGNTTSYTYDSFGNRVQITAPNGSITTLSYDGNGRLLNEEMAVTTAVGPDTVSVARTYNANGLLTSVQDGEGATIHYSYDAAGKRNGTVDGAGNSYTLRYSPKDKLENIVYPDLSSISIDYDVDGSMDRFVDRGGNTYTYQYDAADRPTFLAFPDGTAETADNPAVNVQYDPGGLLSELQYPGGGTAEIERNVAGRIVSVTSPVSGTTLVETDYGGRETAVTDALGRTTRFEYDPLGRQVRTLLPDGSSTQKVYDEVGNLVRQIDQEGYATSFEYDQSNRLLAVTDALGGRTEYGYDELGRRILQIDANGRSTRFEYDGNGRQTAIIRPLGQRAEFSYNELGNLAEQKDFNGEITRFVHTELNQLVEKHFPDGSRQTFTYTDGGQLASVTDANGTTRFEYDGSRRPLRRIEPDGTTMEYTWDGNGQVASITVPSGTVYYSYSALNQISRIVDFDGQATDLSYDPVGNLIHLDYPNGTTENRVYDALDRVTTIELVDSQGALLASYTYTYDGRGNRTSVVEGNGRRVDYQYDALSRLVMESISEPGAPLRTLSYTYDPVGNRLRREDSATGVDVYAYDANDQLLSETADTTATTYGYDANGNTVSRSNVNATTTFAWDFEHHLERIRTSDSETRFGYDHIGLLTSISSSAGETRLLNDVTQRFPEVIEEYRVGDGIRTPYTIAGSNRISTGLGAGKHFYLEDGHSGVRMLLNSSGNPTDTFSYDAFGRELERTGTNTDAYRYRGERSLEADTDAYYLRARHLDANSGRFLSQDPFEGLIDTPVSLHRYLYANANPATMVDPGGNFSVTDFAARLAIYGGLLVIGQQVISAGLRAADKYHFKWEGTLAMGSISTNPLAALKKSNIAITTVSIGGAVYRAKSSCGSDASQYDTKKSFYQPKAIWLSLFGGFEVIGKNPLPGTLSVGDFDMYTPGFFNLSTSGLAGGMLYAGYSTPGIGPLAIPDIPGLSKSLQGVAKAGAVWLSGFGAGAGTGFDAALDLSAGVLGGFTLPVWWEDTEECPGGN